MLFNVVISSLLVASALGQAAQSECPDPDGYFADAVQCDKYYQCDKNVITEKLCPDGMAFNDLNPKVEKCDFLFQVDCTDRPELQPAQTTEFCPRQNGYYPVPDPTNCAQFYYCAAGVGNEITCPESLVFSLKTGTCVWPEEAGRTNCVAENVVNFTCPGQAPDAIEAHPRYADPDDCQYFYVCINGVTPRRNGCKFGQVFNTELGACDAPNTVLECKDYYHDYFTEYFNNLELKSGQVSADILAAAITSGFPIPEQAKRRISNPTAPSSPTINKRRRGQKPSPLDDGDATSFGDTAAAPASRRERPQRKRLSSQTSETGLQRRGSSRPRPRPAAQTTTTTTTTTTTPPPPPASPDAAYEYDYPEGDYVYYDEYPAEEAAAAAPAPTTTTTTTPEPTTQASRRRPNLRRRPLTRPRTETA